MHDEKNSLQNPKIRRLVIQRVITLAVFILIMSAILFGFAGTFRWLEAWIYMGLYVGMVLAISLILLPRDPALVAERARTQKNSKGWDKWLVWANTLIANLGLLVLSGLDFRYRWSPLPNWTLPVGIILLLVSMFLGGWAMSHNRFFSAIVRIQTDRNHCVIDSGPYAIVRHPAYLGIMFSAVGLPLLLRSGWAFIPSFIGVIIIIVRTTLEDRTLQAELPGYMDYCQRTRYRLLPGIW